jgi:hypothetical protein
VPPETTSGPLLMAEFPLLLYVGAGAEAVTGRFFRSKSEGTSDGGGLGGRWAGVPHFAIESRGPVGTRLGTIAGAESMVRLGRDPDTRSIVAGHQIACYHTTALGIGLCSGDAREEHRRG